MALTIQDVGVSRTTDKELKGAEKHKFLRRGVDRRSSRTPVPDKAVGPLGENKKSTRMPRINLHGAFGLVKRSPAY